jgi:hypothetical protein
VLIQVAMMVNVVDKGEYLKNRKRKKEREEEEEVYSIDKIEVRKEWLMIAQIFFYECCNRKKNLKNKTRTFWSF